MKVASGQISTIDPWSLVMLNFNIPSFGINIPGAIDQKFRIAGFVTLVLLLCGLGIWISQYLFSQVWPLDMAQTNLVIGMLLLIYAICMMLPFMPAIELGLVLLAMLDIQGVIMLYGITVVALSISFAVGQLVPIQVLARLFHFLHFRRAAELVKVAGSYGEQEQVERLIQHSPRRLVPFLLRHRYGVFGVAVNTPGNVLLGGAGGIAMISGISRLFNFGSFVLMVMIAVSPLPVIVILMKLFVN